MVNCVVPFTKTIGKQFNGVTKVLELSPMALRMLKGAFNADADSLAGLQQFAGDATLMYFHTIDEAKEDRDAFKRKTQTNFKQTENCP